MWYQRNRSAPSIIQKSDNLPIYCDNLLHLPCIETAVTSPVTKVTKVFALIVFTKLKDYARNVSPVWYPLEKDAPSAEGKG